MQISTRFSVAIHILLTAVIFKDDYKVTSDFIASSVNTNPVVIRKLMSRLKEAGLINSVPGKGGIELAKPLGEISFRDIYEAVEENKPVIAIHNNSVKECPVGGNIENVLKPLFHRVEDGIKDQLSEIKLEDVVSTLKNMMNNQS